MTKPRQPLRPYMPALLALLLAWSWYVHFWPDLQTANESIRLYFVQAVVETGRPELDAVSTRHGHVPVDRSEFGGHIYMDKAPGLSLLALPIYPLLRAIDPAVETEDIWIFGIVACFLTVTLTSWLLLWVLIRYLQTLEIEPRTILLSVLALGLASPLFAYATLYFGHALAAACVGSAAYLLAMEPEGAGSLKRQLLIGLLLAEAGLTDSPVFALSALIVLWAMARALPHAHGFAPLRRLRAVLPMLLVLTAGVLVQLAYNHWALGNPLRFAYQFKGDQGFAALHHGGFFGFHLPQPDVLLLLLLGPSRGLLYHSPWLVPAVIGLLATAQRRDLPETQRLDAIALVCLALVYAILISGFADWKAGDAAYARHLIPVLPLLVPGLARALDWQPLPRPGRALILASMAMGLLLVVPTVATFPYHFARLERPVLELGWPLWLLGNFSPSMGRAAGWSDWTSATVFLVLVLIPWLLVLKLPRLRAHLIVPLREQMAVAVVAVGICVMWTLALLATVPKPGRVVQVARAQAAAMLGSDADTRDGNKPWQKILQHVRERNQERIRQQTPPK